MASITFIIKGSNIHSPSVTHVTDVKVLGVFPHAYRAESLSLRYFALIFKIGRASCRERV